MTARARFATHPPTIHGVYELQEEHEPEPLRWEVWVEMPAFRVETTWPSQGGSRNGFGKPLSTAAVEEVENQILQLSPQNESQRWFRAEALRLSNEVLKTRWRVLEGGSSLPRTFLNVVIFWLIATFVSFGLYAPRNATVLSVLLVAALSVAAAVFLIVELDGPFDGLIKVSGEPLRFALENLGR